MKRSLKKQIKQIRVQSLVAALSPVRYKLTSLNFNVLDTHNRMLMYLNKKTSTFEDISRQVQTRLDGIYSRMQTTNTILLLYGVALTAISIILLFI